jgi:hypothetical protein
MNIRSFFRAWKFRPRGDWQKLTKTAPRGVDTHIRSQFDAGIFTQIGWRLAAVCVQRKRFRHDEQCTRCRAAVAA